MGEIALTSLENNVLVFCALSATSGSLEAASPRKILVQIYALAKAKRFPQISATNIVRTTQGRRLDNDEGEARRKVFLVKDDSSVAQVTVLL